MTGELVHGDGERTLPYLLLPPEKAALEALAAYLGRATFLVHAGTPEVGELSRVRAVTLAQVLEDFPNAEDELQYPSASLIAVGEVEHRGGFTPSPIEETFDPGARTMLWSLGEARGLLQLDLFADSKALIDALGAGLPALMSPNEGMSGLYLRGSPAFQCRTIRYLLVGHESRTTFDSVYANERRVTASVRWEAPLLALRCAQPLTVRAQAEVETRDQPIP